MNLCQTSNYNLNPRKLISQAFSGIIDDSVQFNEVYNCIQIVNDMVGLSTVFCCQRLNVSKNTINRTGESH